MNNYTNSLPPYSNNTATTPTPQQQQQQQQGGGMIGLDQMIGRNSVSSSNQNSPYGSISNKSAQQQHQRSINNYDQQQQLNYHHQHLQLQQAPPPSYSEEEEPEWCYPSNNRQFILANNIQNSLTLHSSSSSPNPDRQQQQHQHQHHLQQLPQGTNDMTIAQGYTNLALSSITTNSLQLQHSPIAIQLQQQQAGRNSPRSPAPGSQLQQQQQQQYYATLQNNSTNPAALGRQSPYNHNGSIHRGHLNQSKAAVVKQLQEKFNGDVVMMNNVVSGNVGVGVGDSGGGRGSPIINKLGSLQGQETECDPPPHQLQHQQSAGGTPSSLQRVSRMNSTNSVRLMNALNGGIPGSGGDPLMGLSNSDNTVHHQVASILYSKGGEGNSVNINVGGGGGSGGNELNGVNDASVGGGSGERGTYLKSAWIHCRLPLLLLLVALLLIVFLSFSGVLIYFKYVPYKIRGSGTEDEQACEQTTCAFGASCFVDGNGRGSCRCPEVCSETYAPVCGVSSENEITYSNECLLRMFSCQNQKSIRIRHSGECDRPDPCMDKGCLFGSRCVPSADGHYATCECPVSCPNYGDSDDSRPVCGSDGKYYRNRCELDREACKLGKNITVKFYGKCDPCDDEVSCPAPQICHLDENREPVCRCGELCTMDFSPVCGSDGKTYSNDCVMRQEACRSRRDLRVIYRGKCSSGTNPCESRTCRGYSSCAIDKFGVSKCVCAMKCDPLISPVCGSDHRTYDSHCHLTQSACQEDRQITVAYRGICESESLCAQHSCPPGATCSVKTGKGGSRMAVCECPVCPADYDPVCGSDGVSYQNACRLKMEACLNNNPIRLLYPGLCNLIRDFNTHDGCDRKQCDFYSVCISEGSEARCICPKNCSNELTVSQTSVCGTDGTTYDNECALRQAACQLQKFIVVASKGHCDLCADVHCKFGAQCENGSCVCPIDCPPNKEPVCGSNLQTFNNECELQKTACRLGRVLSVHFYGDCTEGLNPAGATSGSSSSSGSGTSFSFSSSSSGSSSSGSSGSGTGDRNLSPFGGGPVDGDADRPKLCEAIRCDFGALCELAEDGFPRCTCQFNCTLTQGNAVCGSDLKLYSNECEMRRDACHRQTELRPRPMELCEETEIRPCNGEEPLKHPDTGEDINCGNGPSRTSCPPATYCHRSSTFAKCCKKPEERTTTRRPQPKPQPKCDESIHGCCPDGVTSALGDDHAGCPSVCGCNKLGSIVETCDPFTQECQCRHGVGGPKCDRCESGFWGLSRIAIEGHLGCRECRCSTWGAIREDCEQMTGRCVCKPGVLGHKCDSCQEGEFLGPYGCTSDPVNLGRTCHDIVCGYGAECEQDGNRAGCICNMHCPDNTDTNEELCASDGFTYESECMVRLQSCRSQKAIWVAHKGPCLDSGESDGTESPIRRWTGLHYTEPGDDGMDLIGLSESARSNGELWRDQVGTGFSSGMKSTRHLPPQSHASNSNGNGNNNKGYHDQIADGGGHHHHHHHNNNNLHLFGHRSPTSATIQMKSFLGDACQSSTDCITAHSICLSGWCICREGFYEDSERLQCRQIHSHLSWAVSCRKSSTECQSPASCFDHRNGTYSCLCPLGTGTGVQDGCSIEEPPQPFFSSRSTITLGKLAGYHKLSLELEITPYLNYAHGILIFSSQHGNGSGDFLSLALIDGYIEFRYDLGDGPAILRSTNRLLSGTTYHIVAKRYNRDGLLRVDGEEDVKGTSPGSMKSLNLDHGSFMGFIPLNTTKIWEIVGTSEGFVGCIHKLRVGRRLIDFARKKDSLLNSVTEVHQCPMPSSFQRLSTTPMYAFFEADDDLGGLGGNGIGNGPEIHESGSNSGGGGGHSKSWSKSSFENDNTTTTTLGSAKSLCSGSSRNPCHNHGQCWNDLNSVSGYRCICHPEFTGKHCESRTSKNLGETGAMLDFRGFSYLTLPKIDNGGRQVTIELWLMLRSNNSLILYNGQEESKGDFITIIILHGQLQFLFDLGSGIANLTWPQPISLNKWHWILASREGRDGKLQVDGQTIVTAKSPPSLSELNLELPLYFGGVGESTILHRDFGSVKSFDGALQYIRINGETYHKEISNALRERTVHRYEGPPCGSSVSHPCGNGGTCLPRLESFVCLCPAQFSGKSCEGRKEVPGPVRFDGQNYMRLPRKISKHESFNVTDYDDFYNDHFDSQLDELFGVGEGGQGQGGQSKGSKSHDNNDDDDDYDSDFVDADESDDFVPLLEDDVVERSKAQLRNRLEIVFRTTSGASGVLIWTGQNLDGPPDKRSPSAASAAAAGTDATLPSRRGYLGLFIVDGYPELRINLDATKNKKPVIIRSKVKVNDNRWHQVLIARRRRLIVLQVDGSIPRRATAASDSSSVLVTDGKYWIGGVAGSVLPGEVPPSYHQGFVGCVDLVRIEKRRLPLAKIAYASEIPFCEDET